MTRIMYDSDNPSAIPVTATMVAGYIDGGAGRWSQADWDRFPNATKVRIVRRDFTNDGDVIDCEEGIVWPPDKVVNWVIMRRLAGAWPSVYCNQLNGWPLVRRAFLDRGVEEPPYWVARYNGVEDIPTGAVAKQFANPFLHQQGHFDLSIVANHWPGIDREQTVADDVLSQAAHRINAMSKLHEHTDADAPFNPNEAVALSNYILAINAKLDHVVTVLDQLTAGGGITLVPEGAITVHAQPRP